MGTHAVHSIFPTPIYTVICDEDIGNATNFLNSSHELIPNNHANVYGNKSTDDYILDNPECAKLKQVIQHHIEQFADQALAWEFENFQITQSWITIKEPGEMHGPHYHPNSVLSAVFYFNESEEETSHLVFHRPEIISQLMNQFAPATSTNKMNNTEFAWNHWSVSPKKNTLVIFPSWVTHSVQVNTTNVPRKSLAVNSIPTGKFGSRESSAEIDISRLK